MVKLIFLLFSEVLIGSLILLTEYLLYLLKIYPPSCLCLFRRCLTKTAIIYISRCQYTLSLLFDRYGAAPLREKRVSRFRLVVTMKEVKNKKIPIKTRDQTKRYGLSWTARGSKEVGSRCSRERSAIDTNSQYD